MDDVYDFCLCVRTSARHGLITGRMTTLQANCCARLLIENMQTVANVFIFGAPKSGDRTPACNESIGFEWQTKVFVRNCVICRQRLARYVYMHRKTNKARSRTCRAFVCERGSRAQLGVRQPRTNDAASVRARDRNLAAGLFSDGLLCRQPSLRATRRPRKL